MAEYNPDTQPALAEKEETATSEIASQMGALANAGGDTSQKAAGEGEQEQGNDPKPEDKVERGGSEQASVDSVADMLKKVQSGESLALDEAKEKEKADKAKPDGDAAAGAAKTPTSEEIAAKAAADKENPFKDIDEVEPPVRMHPDSKKALKALKQIARAEREAKISLEGKLSEYQKRETEAQSKGVELPEAAKKRMEELEKELGDTRARIREMDIRADPEMARKYDQPIQRARDAIVAVLKKPEYGLGQKAGKDGTIIAPTEDSIKAELAKIEREGFSPSSLGQFIRAFEQAGLYGEAENVRTHLRNITSAEQARDAEIADWKQHADARQTERKTAQEREATTAAEKMNKAMYAALDETNTRMAEKLPFLAKPAPAGDKDAPDVKKARETALKAHGDAMTAAGAEMNALLADLGDPAKAPEANGRIRALVASAMMVQKWGIPQIVAQLQPLKDRNAALEKEIGSLRNAGKLGASAETKANGAGGGTKPQNSSQTGQALVNDVASQLKQAMGEE